MQVRSGLLFLATLLLLYTATSCGITLGDPVRPQSLSLRNATHDTVRVYVGRADRLNPPDYVLESGETRRSGIDFPPSGFSRKPIRAYDDSGNLIFCRTFSIGADQEPGPVLDVDIVAGEINC